MSKELTEEAVSNLSKICKGGKEAALDALKRHGGDIIKKEMDKYGNIKYYFTEHGYFYYDFLMVEMDEDNLDDD